MLKSRDGSSSYQYISLRAGKFGRQVGHTHHLITTDSEGKFKFPPKDELSPLFVAHPTGFAVLETPEIKKRQEVQLQPWASISGRIQGFGKDIQLYVNLSQRRPRLPGDPRRKPGGGLFSSLIRRIGGSNRAKASEQTPLLPETNIIAPNAKGEFSIEKVPPGHWWLVVSQKEKMDGTPNGPFTLKAIRAVEVDAKAGAPTTTLIELGTQKAASQD
jgi:hypothetical protein